MKWGVQSMALISKLNATISDVLSVPLPTVSMYSRRLREAGKLSEKGRGRGAAQATPLDAARLLLALMVNLGSSRAAQVVTDFGELIPVDTTETEERGPPLVGHVVRRERIRLHDVYALSEVHTFEEAFAAIIRGFADLSFATKWCNAALAIPGRNNVIERFFPADCRVVVIDTALQTSVHLAGNQYNYSCVAMRDILRSRSYEEQKLKCDEYETGVAARYRRGIESVRTIDFSELRKIARVVNGHEIDLDALLKKRKVAEMATYASADSDKGNAR